MTKIYFSLITSLICVMPAFSQTIEAPDFDALEGVIVEKYYVSGPGDVAGGLPEGSTTYRIFADLKPEYTIQSVVGTLNHPLIINAGEGEVFFNSEFGATFGSNFTPFLLNFGTAPLDSYLAFNGATQTSIAVPKSMDTDGSILTGADGYLQNVDLSAGLSPLVADGFMPGTVATVSEITGSGAIPFGTYFGTADSPDSLYTGTNSSWFDLNQVSGPTEDNIIYIGQFTVTSCVFKFNLNVQVIIPPALIGLGGKNVISYVAVHHPMDDFINTLPNIGGDNRYFYQRDDLDFDNTTDCTIVSVRDRELPQNSWSLFPNPSAGRFFIQLNENLSDVSYEVYDIAGKKLINNRGAAISGLSNLEIDGAALTNGLYLVKLNASGQTSTKRLVINR